MSNNLEIIKPLTVATPSINGIDLGEAKYVHCGNTANANAGNTNATRFVVITDAANTVKATVMLGYGQSIVVEKERTDKIRGSTGVGGATVPNNNVVFTKVSVNGQA